MANIAKYIAISILRATASGRRPHTSLAPGGDVGTGVVLCEDVTLRLHPQQNNSRKRVFDVLGSCGDGSSGG